MQTTFSRVIRLFVVFILACGLFPVPALADTSDRNPDTQDLVDISNDDAADELDDDGLGSAVQEDGHEFLDLGLSKTEEEKPETAMRSNELTLKATYSTPQCGSPMTFTLHAENASDQCVYALHSVLRYEGNYLNFDNPIYDTSFGRWGDIYTVDNEFEFTFYASGRYQMRFHMVDKSTIPHKSAMLRLDLVIEDAAYPTPEVRADQMAQDCLAAGMRTDYEKALWLHDWLIDNCEYDNTYANTHAASVFGKGIGTCEAYHQAYTMLLARVGVESRRSEDRTHGMHVWTAVKMDGSWYQVDTTWDDYKTNNRYPDEEHLYFGLTDELIKKAHPGYTGPVPGYESTSLENNYFIKSRKITSYSDRYILQIQKKIDAQESAFSIPAAAENWPENYKEIIYNLVAYELSKTNWFLNGKKISLAATYSNGQFAIKVNVPGEVIASVSQDQMSVSIAAKNGWFSSASSVRFPVWSLVNGQDDLHWYQAAWRGSEWVATVPISAHRSVGTYAVHAYATNSGREANVGGTSFVIHHV